MSSKHRRLRRVDRIALEEDVVGLAVGLGGEVRVREVEHVLEMVEDADLGRDRLGVLARAVGEDEPAPGQPLDRVAQGGVELDVAVVDVVHEVHEIVGDRWRARSSAPAGSLPVAVVVVLLQRPRRNAVDPEEVRHVERDPVDSICGQNLRLVRIERVVEVERSTSVTWSKPRASGGGRKWRRWAGRLDGGVRCASWSR